MDNNELQEKIKILEQELNETMSCENKQKQDMLILP
jgi:hypothetical protein